jgi:hypothetical protein
MSDPIKTTKLWAIYQRWGSKSDTHMYVAIAGIWMVGAGVLIAAVGSFACFIGVVCK